MIALRTQFTAADVVAQPRHGRPALAWSPGPGMIAQPWRGRPAPA